MLAKAEMVRSVEDLVDVGIIQQLAAWTLYAGSQDLQPLHSTRCKHASFESIFDPSHICAVPPGDAGGPEFLGSLTLQSPALVLGLQWTPITHPSSRIAKICSA